MTADMPTSAGEDGTDGLGAVPSVLPILRTDGTVDNTAFVATNCLVIIVLYQLRKNHGMVTRRDS
jgi:hypothetical protein